MRYLQAVDCFRMIGNEITATGRITRNAHGTSNFVDFYRYRKAFTFIFAQFPIRLRVPAALLKQ